MERTVLVVAGEDTARMLTGLLEEGTAVLQEVSVAEALRTARRAPVDLILAADEQRAGELKRRLTEHPETADIPVLGFGRVIEAPAFRAEVADLLPPPEPADSWDGRDRAPTAGVVQTKVMSPVLRSASNT
jgi:hypothetical protein